MSMGMMHHEFRIVRLYVLLVLVLMNGCFLIGGCACSGLRNEFRFDIL
jgi:hypothetical protein